MSRPSVADRLPLSERRRPTRLQDLIGNPRARAELVAWANSWSEARPPARRAVLLVGPPGVGKTSAAIALSTERGWALVEMNASDARNQTAIERVAGRASISHALDDLRPTGGPSRTLVLLDEADCLTGGRTTEGARVAREPIGLRTFLEGRYGSIAALNTAWGLGTVAKSRAFESWASVPKSPGNAGWAKLPAARKDLDDWKQAGRPEESGDRGGLPAIARLVRTSRQPLVLTVNDDRPLNRYSPVFRTAVRTIRFGPVAPGELAGRLGTIAREEHIALGPGVLEAIVARSNGDVRAALNDLEAVAALPPTVAQRDLLGGRDIPSDFAGLTEELLSRPRFYRSVEVRDRLDAPPDDLLPWVEENVPWFAPDELHRDAGLRMVAAAELLLARARRWRTYGLWSYATELLTGGVSLSVRETPTSGAGHAMFPRFLGEMGFSRAARGVRDSLARKLGARLHVSRAKSRATVLPFTEALFVALTHGRRRPEALDVARALVDELDLSPEEVAALLGAPPDSRAVRELLPETGDEASDTGARRAPGEPTERGSGPRSDTSRSGVQRNLGDWGRG